jgi:hypothetical protein
LTATAPELKPIGEAAAAAQAPARRESAHWKHKWKKRIVTWARWSHIYLSMVSFAILLFFAATGLTLNHQDWFANQQRTVVYKGSMDRAWLAHDVAQLRIVEQLRQAHGIKAALGELRVDDGQISVNFKGPGYSADVSIDRATGSYDVSETRSGWAAVMNDLHKGRDAGQLWGKVIDAAAVFMTLVAASGLTLIFFLAKWRKPGLVMLGVGALACYLMYVAFVP